MLEAVLEQPLNGSDTTGQRFRLSSVQLDTVLLWRRRLIGRRAETFPNFFDAPVDPRNVGGQIRRSSCLDACTRLVSGRSRFRKVSGHADVLPSSDPRVGRSRRWYQRVGNSWQKLATFHSYTVTVTINALVKLYKLLMPISVHRNI